MTAQDRAFVYAVIRRIVRTDDAAADATQDALLLAHRRRAQFRGDSAFRTWLYKIALMAALGSLRRERRSRELLAIGDAPVGWDLPDAGPSPEQEVIARELAHQASEQVEDVGAPYRDVFLRRMADWADVDIAKDVGISIANVKIRTHRVRLRLRSELREWTTT